MGLSRGWQSRGLLLVAGLQAAATAVALGASGDGTWLDVIGISLMLVGSVGSLLCAFWPSQLVFQMSVMGLVVGYAERAAATVLRAIDGQDVTVARAALDVLLYGWLAILVGYVWLRVVLPSVALLQAEREAQ